MKAEQIKQAIEDGALIVPARASGVPLFPDWRRLATADEDVIAGWVADGHELAPVTFSEGKLVFGDPADDLIAGCVNRTDTGNAILLVERFGQRIRYVPEEDTWYVFNHKIWHEDLQSVAMHRLMGQTLVAETPYEFDNDAEGRELKKWLIRSENHRNKAAAISAARCLPNMSVSKARFDRRRYCINCSNCTLSFDETTGAVKQEPHNASDFSTKLMPVLYNVDARCPGFEAFIEWMLPNTETRGYVQMLLGLSLIGVVDRAIPIFYGAGKNGKSTLMQVLAGLMDQPEGFPPSAGYYVQTSMATFTVSHEGGDKARPDLKRLAGARIVAAAETNAAGGTPTLDIAILKAWTGGEKISARSLYSNDLAPFSPQGVLLFATNNKPKISDDSDGAWDRIKLIPCLSTVTEGARVLDFHLKLLEERSGILNWLIRGLKAYMAAGKNPPTPQEVKDATAEYRVADDGIASFLDDAGILTGNLEDSAPAKDVYDLYKETVGRDALPKSQFNEWFRAKKRLARKERGYRLLGVRYAKPDYGG